MAEAMRIRATMQGDVADVRVAMRHPMETGLRKNDRGELVPLYFITRVVATHNGKTVMEAHWSQGISRDPFWAFRVKGVVAGDEIAIAWLDNRGDKGGVTTVVMG